MKRLWVYLLGLVITVIPAVIFLIFLTLIINLYIGSGGHFWVGIYRGFIDFSTWRSGIQIYLWLFVLSVISFVAFVFFLIMFLRELRKIRKTKKEQERKLTESYTI